MLRSTGVNNALGRKGCLVGQVAGNSLGSLVAPDKMQWLTVQAAKAKDKADSTNFGSVLNRAPLFEAAFALCPLCPPNGRHSGRAASPAYSLTTGSISFYRESWRTLEALGRYRNRVAHTRSARRRPFAENRGCIAPLERQSAT